MGQTNRIKDIITRIANTNERLKTLSEVKTKNTAEAKTIQLSMLNCKDILEKSHTQLTELVQSPVISVEYSIGKERISGLYALSIEEFTTFLTYNALVQGKAFAIYSISQRN